MYVGESRVWCILSYSQAEYKYKAHMYQHLMAALAVRSHHISSTCVWMCQICHYTGGGENVMEEVCLSSTYPSTQYFNWLRSFLLKKREGTEVRGGMNQGGLEGGEGVRDASTGFRVHLPSDAISSLWPEQWGEVLKCVCIELYWTAAWQQKSVS